MYGLNRIRNLHKHIEKEWWREYLYQLREWEHLEKEMSSYRKHHRFMPRCKGQDIIPVILKLKTSKHLGHKKLSTGQKGNYWKNGSETSITALNYVHWIGTGVRHAWPQSLKKAKCIRHAKISYTKLGRGNISRSWNTREENLKECLTKKGMAQR